MDATRHTHEKKIVPALTPFSLRAPQPKPLLTRTGALFAPMKLYLESQVAAAASARHGGAVGPYVDTTPAAVAAALEPARATRLEARLSDRARKRGAAERAAADTAGRLARARARIDAHAAEVSEGVGVEEGGAVSDGGSDDGDSTGRSGTSSEVVEVGDDGEPVDSKAKPSKRKHAPPPPGRPRRRAGARVEREII